MKQPLISRLATRRSFAKTALAGVGVFLGAGIWAEVHAVETPYLGEADKTACESAIDTACNALPQNKITACKATLKAAMQAGRTNAETFSFTHVDETVTTSSTLRSMCAIEVTQDAMYCFGMGQTGVNDITSKCCGPAIP